MPRVFQKQLRSILECVRTLETEFRRFGVGEAALSAEYIVAHSLGYKTLSGVTRDTYVTRPQMENIQRMKEQRKANMPVQYVLGDWDFRSLGLTMKQPVFIPRPETEDLVEYIVSSRSSRLCPEKILDIGCGSGALALALLQELPKAQAVALDISSEACQLTLHNAAVNKLDSRLQVIQADVTDLAHTVRCLQSYLPFDLVVSNPPYVLDKDMEALPPEVAKFEDLQALSGGYDGLRVIEPILRLSSYVLDNYGSLWMEVDSSHPGPLAHLTDKYSELHLHLQSILQDFRDRPRFVELVYQPP